MDKSIEEFALVVAIFQGFDPDDDAVFGRAVERLVRRTETLITKAGPHRLAQAMVCAAHTPGQLRDFMDVVVEAASQPRARKLRTRARGRKDETASAS